MMVNYITSEDENEVKHIILLFESRADRSGKHGLWIFFFHLDENYDDAIYKINQALDFDDRHI